MLDVQKQELFTQLEAHLRSTELNWLLGAGISFDANLPLMYPLTDKVLENIETQNFSLFNKVVNPLKSELDPKCHIEHVLSHLGDYAALAERSSAKSIKILEETVTIEELKEAHQLIIQIISNIIRFGYKKGLGEEPDKIGTADAQIVCVQSHCSFIDALFNYSQAGVSERRKAVNLFTTNYDTLLEDGLALNRIPYWDGFSGGAVAYRSVSYGENIPTNGQRANLIKIHGSIDWHLCEKGYIWRVRDNNIYPSTTDRVLIYPQATKYIATQQDPFSTQFDFFRKSLHSSNSNVLAVCGYSFGDEHINNEIEMAMAKDSNRTTLVAFLECDGEIPSCLDRMRKASYGNRVYIAAKEGLYVGSDDPIKRIDDDKWWTFKGVTDLLKNGCEV